MAKDVVRRSGLLGAGIALIAALLFWLVASSLAYEPVARVGGAIWVFILTWVITMPTLARRRRGHVP